MGELEERKDDLGKETLGEPKVTSEKEPETFTKETQEKAVSDALAKAGRDAKSLEQREQALKAANEKAAQTQRDRDAAELEAASGDSDEEKRIRAKQTHRDTVAELAKVKSELEEEKLKGQQKDTERADTDREIAVWGIAQKHGVYDVTHKNLTKFSDGSTEAIEAIAQSLPKKGEQKPPLDLVFGRTIGGGDMPDSAKGKIRAGWDELHK